MIRRFFRLDELGTSLSTEVIAGATTFLTMAYIIVVNPAILGLAAAKGSSLSPEAISGSLLTATVLAAFVGTLLMGLYARRPFAVAPYMGENAFVAFTVVLALGFTYGEAMVAILIGGVLFVVLTVLGLRGYVVRAVPESLKYAFVVGIGLFLALIGLNKMGVVHVGVPDAPLQIGNLGEPAAQLGIVAFVAMGILVHHRVPGAILLVIVGITGVGAIFGQFALPEDLVGLPESPFALAFGFDFGNVATWGFLQVLLVVFLMDFLDTMGTLIGVSSRAGLLDERGNLPEIEKPMLCDAVATVAGACMGTTTTGTFIESAAGIESGGRSGLSAVVTAVLFLPALFLAPIVGAIPDFAYMPALVLVGVLMLKPAARIRYDDVTEVVPAFATIVLMAFTYNIGVGMTAGLVLYPLMKLAAGRWREIHPALIPLSVISLRFLLFCPYSSMYPG
jgi:AGZA family xanthine/uracil permease-like MFS transporter